MNWEKVGGSKAPEKLMIWEAQPGGCGKNEMCEFRILEEGAL